MKKISESLPFKNLTRRPARAVALVAIAALLSFTVFCGALIVRSFNRGLTSLKERMGADIMVVPFEATTKSDIAAENVALLGHMGYFYMDAGLLDKIASTEGVGQVSAQFFLSSTSSGCCSVPVQIVGYDPETDFTITPWIKKSYGRDLRDMEVVVGNDLNAFVGDTLTFYGVDVTVAAKLEQTGTNLDTAVYTNANTIRALIGASIDLRMNTYENLDPARVVSCVLVNVADGASVDEVLNDINVHVRKVKAFRTANMIEGVAASLSGATNITRIFAVAIWALSLILLAIVFSMSVSERKREFAVLRAIGASTAKVERAVMAEGALASVTGAVCGAGLGALLFVPFAGLIESELQLPFLLPSSAQIFLVALVAVVLGAVCGALASARAARRVAKIDAGRILREPD